MPFLNSSAADGRARRSLLFCCALGGALPAVGQGDTASQEPEPVVWDLTDLYPDVEAWEAARQEILEQIPDLRGLEGSLHEGPAALYEALQLSSDLFRQAGRVRAFASLRADEDVRVAENQERSQLARQLYTQLAAARSWIEPEMIAVGPERIESYLEEESRLEPFAHYVRDVLRSADHTLGQEAEAILASASQPLGAGYSIYNLLANGDIPWPTIELPDGESVRLDSQGYSTHRQSQDRSVRKEVFDAYWGKWAEYENTVGQTLFAHLQAQSFLAEARKFESVLERELFSDNLPLAVYETLVEQVNEALPTLHRYFRLRGRMLGVEQMHYYDIYPSVVDLEDEFTLDEAKRLTLAAMAVLGEDWQTIQREAMDQQWMHVYPQPGKRSGAYQNRSAYDVHPYLLLNFDGTYDAVSTFAHEWGHAMHTLYAKAAQPYQTAGYTTFIAEIPSTSLELLLQERMVEQASSPEEKLFYLGSALEAMRGTFFRQTMFAEFELSLYRAVERGEALSGEKITGIYAEIVRRYHGHDKGVVRVDDAYTREWMFIPHFYYNMYVFQYATSMTAGAALYDAIQEEGVTAVERFKDLLRAGSSDYPHRLLQQAGVDLTQPEPYRTMVARMNAIMDQMEAILAEQEG